MVEFFIIGLICYGLFLKYNVGRTSKKNHNFRTYIECILSKLQRVVCGSIRFLIISERLLGKPLVIFWRNTSSIFWSKI